MNIIDDLQINEPRRRIFNEIFIYIYVYIYILHTHIYVCVLKLQKILKA